MNLLTLAQSDRRLPALERLFLLVVVLVSGTVTMPQFFDFGVASGLGLWTYAVVAGSWVLWVFKPAAPRFAGLAALSLVALVIAALCSSSWGTSVPGAGAQLLLVILCLPGLILLASRESANNLGFRISILTALDTAAVFSAVAYSLTIAVFGPGGDAMAGDRPIFLARPFALFALVAAASQLARWHSGRPAGLINAVWILALVILSQSRLGMVTIMAMFPISYLLVGGKKNAAIAGLMFVTGALGLTLLLMFSQTMYDRFFGYDASLQVGGVSINAMGRTAAWTALLGNIHSPSEWIFGHGAGEASTYCENNFVNLPHPHNDYIRFLYDFGALGLSCFLIFVGLAFTGLFKRMNHASRIGNRTDAALARGGILAMIGVLASMATDNSANYIFVMSPLAVLIGTAIAIRLPTRRQLADVPVSDGYDWVFEANHANGVTHDAARSTASTSPMISPETVVRSTEPYA